MIRPLTVTLALLAAACPRGFGRPATLDHAAAEEITRRIVLPSLLQVSSGLGGGTAFACLVPGIACTAQHVVGKAKEVRVRRAGGQFVTAAVLKGHPLDDVALLDVRALEPAPAPLAVSLLDPPAEGTLVCRTGYPPGQERPFLRCDPVGGILHESMKRADGAVLPRLIHLGVGLKGDSGAPIFDPVTELIVGVHVAEANGTARGALAVAILDTFATLEGQQSWLRGCARSGTGRLATLSLRLQCSDLPAAERAASYREIGIGFLDLRRRGEALSAFEEVVELEPTQGRNWLWRALVFPTSAHARDDAALAFRLDGALRDDAGLRAEFRGRHLDAARALRDEVAPPGARLATLVGPGACASCERFCAAARSARDVRLWAVEDANHPVAESMLRRRLPAATDSPLQAVDGRTAAGCGKLLP